MPSEGMDLNHVRFMGTIQLFDAENAISISFTRSFLADQYKGWSDKTEVSHSNSKRISAAHRSYKTAQKCKTENMKCSARSLRTKRAVLQERVTNAPVPALRKYYSSVSHTLRVLCHSSSDEGTEDSNSDSEVTDECDPADAHPTTELSTSHRPKPIISTPPVVPGEFELDYIDLESALRNLGLPTSFGPVRKARNRAGSRSSMEPDSSVTDQLLLRTYVRNPSCPANVILRRSASSQSLFDKSTGSPLRRYSSSGNLSDFQKSVFRTWCNLLELSCDFTQPRCSTVQEFSLHLAPAWTFADFNLHAFLYCRRHYWRYEAPSTATERDTVLLEEPPQWESIRLDPIMNKYWSQRLRLFSKLYQGIQMDRDSFFSATPEAIAVHHAMRIRHALSSDFILPDCATVVDAFCGTGCSAIQLALMGFRVVAVEIDPTRLSMAKHNAAIYGVASKIDFVCADFFVWAKSQLRGGPTKPAYCYYEAVFMSPPWGGPAYLNSTTFDINCIQFETSFGERYTFWHAVRLASELALGRVFMYMPRNTNMAQLPALNASVRVAGLRRGGSSSSTGWRMEVEANILNFKLKALTIYFGSLCVAARGSRTLPASDSACSYLNYCDDSDTSSCEYSTALED